MQIRAFDYVRDRPAGGGSLAKLATLIDVARAEAASEGRACLLFDNGDTFQGNPIGDLMARKPAGALHPMVHCMNLLNYDAGGLDNHDFDYGIDHLAGCLEQHRMPLVCTNLTATRLPMVRKSHLVDCPITLSDGTTGVLKVGVLSSLPRKTALWSRHHVEERASFAPPLPVLRDAATALRAAGADVVVVLAHMGLALFHEGEDPQNQISEVADIDDVDIVIGGHTHLRFPGPDHAGIAEADCSKGTVHGTPVVQPGASASDLGLIDVTLEQSKSGKGWYIANTSVALRPATPDTPERADIVEAVAEVHNETRSYLSQNVSHLKKPMHSYFALAHPSPVPALLAAAKRHAIVRSIAGSALAELPLLSAASASFTGGFDGPENFVDLPAGQINRHHVAGMNPYANHVWAVKTTGAHLRDWLERSTLIFNTLESDRPDQLLIDPRVPGFRYDTIYGLTYEIDPRADPLFDPSGKPIPGREGRIRNLCWDGTPLVDDQVFLVATTDHRAGGGGLYKTFGKEEIVIQGRGLLQDAVFAYLQAPSCTEVRDSLPWSFARGMDRTAILLTAPEAIHHLEDIGHLNPEPCGTSAEGFLRLRLHL